MNWALPARRVTITTDSKTNAQGQTSSLVWDFPTRAFHWLLALSLCGSWATAEAGFEWIDTHNLLGYFALGLVLFRLLWGIFGPRHARFSSFIKGPRAVLATVPKLFSRRPGTDVGHNPIGGWSAILFLVLVSVQAGTGLFISDDVLHFGPYNHVISSSLAGQLAQVHHLNFTALQTFVVVHLLAIAWYQFGKGTGLVGPMVTGKKHLQDASLGITSSQLLKGLIIGALAAAAVTALIQLAPEPKLDDFLF